MNLTQTPQTTVTLTVSGVAYFEALDPDGTSAAKWGVPSPTRIERAGRGYQAVYADITIGQARAIHDVLRDSGGQDWINTLRGEKGNGIYTAAEIRAAKACAAAAAKVAKVIAATG